MGVIDLRLDLNETIKYNLELEEIDVSNSIDSDKLTEEDLSKFEELMTNKGFTKLMDDFNKIDFENIVTSF